jgi:hypothetical protein
MPSIRFRAAADVAGSGAWASAKIGIASRISQHDRFIGVSVSQIGRGGDGGKADLRVLSPSTPFRGSWSVSLGSSQFRETDREAAPETVCNWLFSAVRRAVCNLF